MAEGQPVVYTGPDQIQLRNKEMDLEWGWLGRVFGSAKNAPINIAGITVVILVAAGVVLLFAKGAMDAWDYWKLITPFLTLVLGYLFGVRTGS